MLLFGEWVQNGLNASAIIPDLAACMFRIWGLYLLQLEGRWVILIIKKVWKRELIKPHTSIVIQCSFRWHFEFFMAIIASIFLNFTNKCLSRYLGIIQLSDTLCSLNWRFGRCLILILHGIINVCVSFHVFCSVWCGCESFLLVNYLFLYNPEKFVKILQ
jgi:hypothetical protein